MMAEKEKTKILTILTICIMLISVGLSGCVEEDEENKPGPFKRTIEKNYQTINQSIAIETVEDLNFTSITGR